MNNLNKGSRVTVTTEGGNVEAIVNRKINLCLERRRNLQKINLESCSKYFETF